MEDYEWPPMWDESSTWERAYREWDRRTTSDLARCLRQEGAAEDVIAVILPRYDELFAAFPKEVQDATLRLKWASDGMRLNHWAKQAVDQVNRWSSQ